MNKTISEFLTGNPANTIRADATAMDAITAMTSERHDYVLVMDNETIAGIFTERDFLNRVLGERLSPAEVSIWEVMTPNPEYLVSSDYIAYAIERMARYGFRNIPIVDPDKPPMVLTIWNVMSHLSEILADVEEDEIDRVILEEFTDTGGG
ncbi:MAG: CBS domain-containing protein [Gammaproteobacteria bacterium]